jgi:hypothetical protein
MFERPSTTACLDLDAGLLQRWVCIRAQNNDSALLRQAADIVGVVHILLDAELRARSSQRCDGRGNCTRYRALIRVETS